MVKKPLVHRVLRKRFTANLLAPALAIFIAFQPCYQIFAQEKPMEKPIENTGSKEILGTETIETRTNPDNGKANPTDTTDSDTGKIVPEDNSGSNESGGKIILDDAPMQDGAKEEPKVPQDEHPNDPPPPTGDRTEDGNARTTPIVPESLKRGTDVTGNDGSFSYNYELALPPGRNNLAPNINIKYSSNDKSNDSPLGYGWSLDIPYIERVNKTGSEKLYTADYFTSSMTGELVHGIDEQYVSKVDNGEFMSYSYDGTFWIAYDKSGTKYTFGSDAAARQDDPNDDGRVYKWMIQEIRDTNDNYIKFEYFKDNGQIYPETITYTGNGSTDGIFEVDFTLESYDVSPVMYYADFPIKTDYRLSSIEVKENGNWVRHYDLAYTTGDAGYRSLMHSITESARDVDTDQTKEKDPTVFTYKARGLVTWTEDTDWNLPTTLTQGSDNNSKFIQIKDVNGDAYPDLVYRNYSNDWFTYLNKGDGTWDYYDNSDSYPTWIPAMTLKAHYGYQDPGTRIFDFNGDMLTDFIRSFSYATDYTNSAPDEEEKMLGTASPVDSWIGFADDTVPIAFSFKDDVNKDNGADIVDINGDGIPDIVRGIVNYSGSWPDDITQNTYIGNGENWTEASEDQWVLPHGTFDVNDVDIFTNAQFPDLNGDGLNDFIYGDENSSLGIRNGINNGHTWDTDIEWYVPAYTQRGLYYDSDNGVRFFDANGDGLADLVISNTAVNTIKLNNPNTDGPNFSAITTDPIPVAFTGQYAILADLNADGMEDIAQAYIGEGNTQVYHTYLSDGSPFTDMLVGIENPEGGSSEISYKLSTKYFDDGGDLLNPHLPIAVTTVDQITTYDGFGNTAETNYTYANGHYYFNISTDRKFAGFGLVTETDPVGNVTKTYFHQGDDTNSALGENDDNGFKIGKLYRIEKYDDSDNLYDLTVNKWEDSEIIDGAHFVYKTASTYLSYDGDGDHRDTAVEYAYDTDNGNLTSKTSWGEVTGDTDGTWSDSGTDEKIENYEYAVDSNDLIRDKVSQYETIDQSSITVNKKKIYYDGQSLGDVTVGNPTTEDTLIDGSTYSEVIKNYDGTYGLVTDMTDPDTNVTSYAYDTYNLYPETITNALSQKTDYEYDYSSGKPKLITDPNGTKTAYVYDGFDRVVEEQKSDPADAGTLVSKNAYAYDDASGEISVDKTVYIDGSTTHDEYQYFDGLGRLIQERIEAEGANTYNVKDTAYDALGRVYTQSLPYEDSGSAITSPTSNSDLLISYAYDPLDRITSATNVIGDTQYAYDQWKTTITNQNGVDKDLYKDAYGNLVQVDEHNDANIYTTLYGWNLNGKLTHIEDDLGNVRDFTYDDTGNRLTAKDLHASADTKYGEWSYEYDPAGNLTQTIDPNGATTTRHYDQLNRVEDEDSDWNMDNPDITYTYDACSNGVGRICSVTNAQGITTNYSYAADGVLAGESRTIASNGYDTSYEYDRQGNLTLIQNPDRSVVEYTRNKGNQIETIVETESGQSPTDIVSDVDYGPNGLPTYIEYGNGVTTTNTYDDTAMYRLLNILTLSDGHNLQDILFNGYDNMGNIMSIKDQSETNAAREVSYTYDDLNRLMSADAINTANSVNYSLDFTYNSIGDITSSDVGSYTYAGNTGDLYANPHAATSIGSDTITYDKNGNTLTDGTLTNTWDYKNELTKTGDGVLTLAFAYDHEGNRMSVDDGTNVDYYPTKYYSEIATVQTKDIYLDNQLVATVEDTGANAVYHYNHTDQLSGSNITTDSNGDLEQTLDYLPYGEVRLNDQVTSFDQKRKFAGSVYDEETGLNYMQNRFQDGRVGRFISEDHVFLDMGDEKKVKEATNKSLQEYLTDPQRLNSYSYAGNNPLKNIDPKGEDYLEFGGSVSVMPYSLDFGVKVDFRNLRLDVNYGSGVSTGAGADLSVMYSPGDLPKENNYITESINVSGGYGIIGKLSVNNTHDVDISKIKGLNLGADFEGGIGTGVGGSINANLNHNFTILDLSNGRDILKIQNSLSIISNLVKEISKNIKNNKKSHE